MNDEDRVKNKLFFERYPELRPLSVFLQIVVTAIGVYLAFWVDDHVERGRAQKSVQQKLQLAYAEATRNEIWIRNAMASAKKTVESRQFRRKLSPIHLESAHLLLDDDHALLSSHTLQVLHRYIEQAEILAKWDEMIEAYLESHEFKVPAEPEQVTNFNQSLKAYQLSFASACLVAKQRLYDVAKLDSSTLAEIESDVENTDRMIETVRQGLLKEYSLADMPCSPECLP